MDYSQKDIEAIIAAVSWNPASFRKLARSKGCSVSDEELVRSLQAWGVDTEAVPYNYPSDKSTWRRQNSRYNQPETKTRIASYLS